MNNEPSLNLQDISSSNFEEDSLLIGKSVTRFLETVYPSYLLDRNNLDKFIEKNSLDRLNAIKFFKIASYTFDNSTNDIENISEKFEKLFSALYSIRIPIVYGVISQNGQTNLVLGVEKSKDEETVEKLTQGMLSCIQMEHYLPNFQNNKKTNQGILAGIPALYVKEKKFQFSLASIMRGLNGQNYTVLFISKPIDPVIISQDINTLICIKDAAFAVSKKNISNSENYTKTNSKTDQYNENPILPQVGQGSGALIGAVIGGTFGLGGGTAIGAGIGGFIGSSLGGVIGTVISQGKSKSFSESVSEAISNGKTISHDIQNGFALELMQYSNQSIERLKKGQNNGFWQTAITYSAENESTQKIIQACLCGELSRCDDEKLPMVSFSRRSNDDSPIMFPDFDIEKNPLCSYINSSELGVLCTVPTESVPDFELKQEKKLPLLTGGINFDCTIGNLSDGKRLLQNMPFGLSYADLNKHTFVCGITGSGKTTSVKKILTEVKKPFLVIESAKKEYRNLKINPIVYTVGKPEINAPQINPFYILPGVTPQQHIDFLKDLFTASFSFYGPMAYILEKCLHTIYLNKGWDLNLGYHPLLANIGDPLDIYDIDYIKEQYKKNAHKYIFPTMRDLRNEICRYVENDLDYDGEVSGNIKTAMKVRLENLCVGTKGYTFNTYNFINFEEMLSKNVVWEIEGLADDSDKAFSVGLLIIFLNEYRQIEKEVNSSLDIMFRHLFVIEEAHRLLRNVESDITSEAFGNPKGKAVEHFTNMLAEMRSYGQGVIVAEQIPTKLAPDVIKNSSTKIVHRIVSLDDQSAIANTIGLSKEDSIQLGTLETGYSYCHKEGMALPCPVKISEKFIDEKNQESELDIIVRDEDLVNENRFAFIQQYVLTNRLNEDESFIRSVFAFVNTLMIEDDKVLIQNSIGKLKNSLSEKIKRVDFIHTSSNNIILISETLIQFILIRIERGAYCVNEIPDKFFLDCLKETIKTSSIDNICTLLAEFQKLYSKNIRTIALEVIVSLIIKQINEKHIEELEKIDLKKTICNYFLDISEKNIKEIEVIIKRFWYE